MSMGFSAVSAIFWIGSTEDFSKPPLRKRKNRAIPILMTTIPLIIKIRGDFKLVAVPDKGGAGCVFTEDNASSTIAASWPWLRSAERICSTEYPAAR